MRRTRSLLVAGAAALLALAAFAACASAWSGTFVTTEAHLAQVSFKLHTSNNWPPLLTDVNVRNVCGPVFVSELRVNEGSQNVPSATGWFTVRHWSHDITVDADIHLSRSGDTVTAKGAVTVASGLERCRVRRDFEAIATAVHGLP